jgi:hypothetical protein
MLKWRAIASKPSQDKIPFRRTKRAKTTKLDLDRKTDLKQLTGNIPNRNIYG